MSQRSSRMKVFSNPSTSSSKKPDSETAPVLRMTMTVSTTMYGSEKSIASRRSGVSKRLDMT